MIRKTVAAGAACLLAAVSTPALAQYSIANSVVANAIGRMNSVDQCSLGMPEDELIEARDPSIATMQRYYLAAGSGGKISPLFKNGKKTKAVYGAVAIGPLDLNKQVDPLAKSGNSLDARPLRFFRASNYATALGQWAVRDTKGSVVGVYTALFERERGAWLIRELAVSNANDMVEPAATYCTSPGDMTQRRISNSEDSIKWAEDQLTKRKLKSEEANAKAYAAEAKGGSDAKKLRAKADKEAKKLADAAAALANAREANAKATAAAEEIKRLTGPASEADRFRLD